MQIRNIQIYYVPFLLCFAIWFSSCKSSQTVSKPPQKQPVVATPAPTPKQAPKETEEVRKPEVVKRNIAFIMPFELEQNFVESTEETIEPSVSQPSLSAINFYEGALMAIDSLKSQHIELKLNAFDTPGDSASIVRMMTNTVIKDADLVIGTFPNNLAPAAARTAKNHNIKLLLTQAGSPEILLNNSNVALTFASTVTQCREMVHFMLDQFPSSNVILVFRTVKREDELATFFRKEILDRKTEIDFQDFNATQKSIEDLEGVLSKSKRNLVFVVSSDEAFVSPVLSLIEAQNIFGIKVVGLPTWMNFESIDFMAFNNIQTHFFDNNFIEQDPLSASGFRNLFISRFHNDPLPSAYNGFELVYRLGSVMKESHQGVDKMVKAAYPVSSKSFDFSGNIPDGLENKSISVLTITDYKLERLNK